MSETLTQTTKGHTCPLLTLICPHWHTNLEGHLTQTLHSQTCRSAKCRVGPPGAGIDGWYTAPVKRALAAGLSLAALASCAPGVTQSAPSTRVLTTGQQWRMNFPSLPDQGALSTQVTSPQVLTVGEATDQQRGMVSFQTAPVRQGTDTYGNYFSYDPVDSDPEFIFALHSRTNLVNRVSLFCLVRMPTDALNVEQQGLFRNFTNTPFSISNDEAVRRYINTGDLAGQPTCSLTRIK